MERIKKNKEKGNGQGTLYKSSKTGLYIGQYVHNGKRHSVYQKKNEKIGDFKKRFNDILSSINKGLYTENSPETVITIAKQYIENKYLDGTISARSYKRELETLEQIKKTCNNFCNMPIQKVNIAHIEKAKPKMREYSNETIGKIWRLLKTTFSIACSPSRKILIYNIMQDINLKKPISTNAKKPLKALSQKECEKLISILDNEEKTHPYRNIVKMQCFSGMRIGEVLARSVYDYDKSNKSLNVHNTLTQDESYNIILGEHTKTYNKKTQIDEGQRYLPLDNPIFLNLLKVVEEEMKKEITNIYNLLFWDYDKNTFISPSEVNSWLIRLNNKYSISEDGLSTHRLRHYAITYWSIIGLPMSVIQYLAGHVNGSKVTSSTYIDVSFDFADKVLKQFKNP